VFGKRANRTNKFALGRRRNQAQKAGKASGLPAEGARHGGQAREDLSYIRNARAGGHNHVLTASPYWAVDSTYDTCYT